MKGYLAYNLTDSARGELLARFSPKFSKIIAHHITIAFGVDSSQPLPEVPTQVEVIGYACNEKIECVVVEIDGKQRRSDGKLFHITLSHNDEAKPVMSNDLLMDKGFEPVERFSITVEPKFNQF